MLTISGIYGREMYETWYKMSVMLQSGLDIRPAITHRFAFADHDRGLRDGTLRRERQGPPGLEPLMADARPGTPADPLAYLADEVADAPLAAPLSTVA